MLKNMDKGPFWIDRKIYYYRATGTINPPLRRKIYIGINEFGLHCVAIYRFGNWSRALWRRSRILGFVPVVVFRFLDYMQRVFY